MRDEFGHELTEEAIAARSARQSVAWTAAVRSRIRWAKRLGVCPSDVYMYVSYGSELR